MSSPFGLPANYTFNPLYMQYMMLMMQNAQQQKIQQQRLQEQQMQNILQAKQREQVEQNLIARNNAEIAAMNQQNIQSAQNIQATAAPQVKSDSKDDGKISFGSKLKNFGKGVGKFFTGMFCDDSGKFSWKRTLTTVAVAAGSAALIVATGGAATPFLVAAGATMGAVQTGKGIYKAATAKTDAEAEKAWQDIGGGTTAIAGSIAGAKGALKTAGKVDVSSYHGVTGALKSTGKCFSESGKILRNGYNNLRTDFTGTIGNAVEVGSTNLKNVYNNTNAPTFFKEKAIGKFDKKIKNIEKQISKTNDAKELAKLNQELNAQKLNRDQLIKQLTAMDGKTPTGYQAVIDKSKADLARYKEELAQIQEQAGSFWKRTAGEKRLISQYKESIAHIENEIKTLEQYQKVASTGYKKANTETIQANKEQLEFLQKGLKEKQNAYKKETNPGMKEALKKEIDEIKADIKDYKEHYLTEGIGIRENYAFAKAKYVIPTKNQLKSNRTWMSAAAVNNGVLPSIKIAPDMISEADAYAQAHGFQSAQQMQEYIQAMQGSQQAIDNADMVLRNTTATNPYMTNMQSIYSMQMPMGNNLSFNDLYVSPYPEMI